MDKNLVTKLKELNNSEISSLVDVIENLENRKNVEIVFTGTLSNGKSTLINALLGRDLLPTSIGATTSSLMFISKGNDKVVYNDKEVELSKENLEIANKEAEIVNVYVENFPYENVVFVDSPGINDILESREGQTFGYVPNADAVVLVVDASKGITQPEKEFFEKYIAPNKKDKIFMVFNKIDMIDEFGETNLKLLSYDITLEENIFAVSALQGVVGKVKNNSQKLESSKIKEFENGLDSYIVNLDKYKLFENRKNQLLDSLKVMLDESLKTTISSFEKNVEELKKEYQELANDLKEAEEKKTKLEKELEKEILELEECSNSVIAELETKITQSFEGIKNKEDLLNNLNNKIIPYINNEFKTKINECFKEKSVSFEFAEMNGFIINIITKIDDYIGDFIDLLLKIPMLNTFKPVKSVAEEFIKSFVDMVAGTYIESEVKEQISNITISIKKEIRDILEAEKENIIQMYEFKELGKYKAKMASLQTLIEKRENKIKENQEKLEEIKKQYEEINKLLEDN